MMRPRRMHGGPGADGGGHTCGPAQSATADAVADGSSVDGSGPDAFSEAYLVRALLCASLRHSEHERVAAEASVVGVSRMRDCRRTEGARGLFRGLPITAVRDFPSHGVYFALYELCQNLQVKRGEETPLSTFVAGGTAGIVSWWSVYPFDVIKSRIQASTGPRVGWMTVAASCVREEGWVRAATLPQWVALVVGNAETGLNALGSCCLISLSSRRRLLRGRVPLHALTTRRGAAMLCRVRWCAESEPQPSVL